MSSPSSPRLLWIDHLRTLIIVLVVHIHACVTYSHVGDWYVKSAQEPTLAAKVPFILWQSHLQAFFMGLLFFISGYFAHASLARRGPTGFIRERLVRLGLPALLYMLVVHPFILVGLNPWKHDWGTFGAFYGGYIGTGRFLRSSGPLWFAVALLLFCLVLTAWRAAGRGGEREPERPSAPPSAAILALVAAGLGFATFLVRLVQPIGTNVYNLQLCFFPQYIVLFIAGLHAGRHGWLVPLVSSSRARTAGWLALIGGPIVLLVVLWRGGESGGLETFLGGWHWQAFALAMWEQLAGVGLSLGLLAWFSRRCNADRPWLSWLSQRSFGVFVLHAPVLVALFMLFRALPQHVYGLVALLTVTGLLASYAAADVARRLPGLRAIL